MFSVEWKKLRVIGRACEARVKDLTSSWGWAAAGRLECYKNRVDSLQYFRVVDFEDPTVENGIVYIKEPKVLRLAGIRLTISPGLEAGSRAIAFFVLEIKSVKHQQFFFGVEHAPVGAPAFPVAVDVIHIDDVQVPRAEKFRQVYIGGSLGGIGCFVESAGKVGDRAFLLLQSSVSLLLGKAQSLKLSQSSLQAFLRLVAQVCLLLAFC